MKIKLIILLFLSGCSWFVPTTIKREVNLIKIDTQVSFTEVESMRLDGDRWLEKAKASKEPAEYEKACEYYSNATEKVIRSYKRIEPHIINIDNFMQGKPAKP